METSSNRVLADLQAVEICFQSRRQNSKQAPSNILQVSGSVIRQLQVDCRLITVWVQPVHILAQLRWWWWRRCRSLRQLQVRVTRKVSWQKFWYNSWLLSNRTDKMFRKLINHETKYNQLQTANKRKIKEFVPKSRQVIYNVSET